MRREAEPTGLRLRIAPDDPTNAAERGEVSHHGTTETKPYVQVVIDSVDTVVHDPDGHYDADRYDRYATFEQARDAALCCIEDVLDEGDYEGEDHKARLEATLRLLEGGHVPRRPGRPA